MDCHKILLSLVILSCIIIPSTAQNSAQDYVNAHNTARAQVGVAPVVWNTTLANCAQNYANQRVADCALTHSNGIYGENLAKGSSSSFSGVSAVNMWVAEKQCYDYNTNSCMGGNSACTTRRWCGTIRHSWGAPVSSAATDGTMWFATTTPRATGTENGLIKYKVRLILRTITPFYV
ncbi:UNVERIFIED_CONTAM: Pathogenesis-related protein 1 [Sesamum radiatum]|uniref:Pathogenesis-related protein 1 n=1 Tax=Sesamum radiatum TaxID=300843 RepID=A0AAW2MY40_SESRA